MKRIITEQKQTIHIEDIQPNQFYIIVKVDNNLLNYTDKGLSYIVGGETYEKEVTLAELIEGGAEAYQFDSESKTTQWIKENL